jgi:hypothetical protein
LRRSIFLDRTVGVFALSPKIDGDKALTPTETNPRRGHARKVNVSADTIASGAGFSRA